MADVFVDKKFPSESLVPKSETGVLNFLKKYPDYNGKDVVIAILDSGVDPCAAGLKHTTNNEVKVIERFDCTGCGDVDTSTKVTAINSTITGLSGRVLKLTNFMKNNNLNGSEYRVGLKCLYDLYPSKVRERIIADYKLKSWDVPQKQLIANISRDIDDFETLNKNNLSNLPVADKLLKEDMACSMEFCNNFEKKFSDIKTTYDCVLYETKDGWIVAIDLTESGDLENALVVKEYTKSHEIKSIDDCLSVSINIHNNGNVVEIVGMCSSHGTHVASITSGNHEESPELNGVAPGAKIISLTIGDGRLSSMETGTALVRAMIKIMELCNAGTKVDVINMSYGEHAHWSNSGRIGELMNEVVNKYGVVWVASAGNHGPALCTIGTPPDISQPSCIGVGAYVSPEMMEAEYALRQKLPANVYTWTSRDPCIDGGDGVTVCAPGAAIASVPEFTMSSAQLMNGTSMAAPHVAGAVGLLISGLKQRKIKYTPYSIRRALSNTATRLNNVDKFAQGNGLLNVEKAFENLLAYANAKENQVRFSVVVGTHSKGILMRHGVLTKPKDFSVNIEPIFFNDKAIEPREKINFNVRLTLVPSESWVQCGTFLDLCYSARQISVKVDPTNLLPGVHTARIKAYDTQCIEKGSLFEIPITVIQPLTVPDSCIPNSVSRKIDFKEPIICKPNTIIRNFIEVPKYATWAVLRLRSTNSSDNIGGRFLIHTMQILPMIYCKGLETQKILPVSGDIDTVHSFKCEENNILEVCIAKYWSNYGEVEIQYSIDFHGISACQNTMIATQGIHRIDLVAYSPEDIQPVIQLKTGVIVLKPSETKITPLTKRDVIPNGRQIYQNVFTFNLHITKLQDISITVPLFSNVLYESEYESQMWMLFDINKMMISCGDAFSNSSYFKIDKGDYVIKLQVRHEKKDLLEKINETFLLVNCKLSNPVLLESYKTYNLAITGSKKLGSFPMKSGQTKPIYVAPLSNEKITKAFLSSTNDKSAKTSSSLTDKYSKTNQIFAWFDGVITFVRDEFGRKCDSAQFQYILNDTQLIKKANEVSVKDTKTKQEEYTEGLRDFQNSMIQKMDTEIADKIYNDLIKEHPDYAQAHLSLIQNIDSADIKNHLPFTFEKMILKLVADNQSENVDKLKETLNKIISLSNLIIDGIDEESLLTYYGLKTDSRTDAPKIRLNMEKQKSLLLDAYTKKIIAIVKLSVFNQNSKEAGDKNIVEEIDTIFNEIGKYTDYTDSKVMLSIVWHSYYKKHYGRLLQTIQKLYDEKLQKDVLKELRLIVNEKKWEHIEKMINKMLVTTNPPNYRLF